MNEEIEPYMAQIMTQLEYLPKEELLKRFVSIEFNRFLNYYKDSVDLNVEERSSRGESGEKGSRNKDGKYGKKSGERVRLKINVGNREGMNPKRILGLINDVTEDKSINIGDIEVTGKFTFFDVFEDQKDKVIKAFDGVDEFEVAEAKGSKSFNERKPRDFDRKPRADKFAGNGFEEKPWRNRERKKSDRDRGSFKRKSRRSA